MRWDDHPDEEWVEEAEGDSDDDLMQCPSCRAAVHEDTQQCPHCGDWITPVYPSAGVRPMWWILLVVALVLSLILFL